MKPDCFSTRLATAACLAVFILLFSACARPPAPRVTGPLPTVAELQARLADTLDRFESLKGFARIEYRDNGLKKAADHVVFVRYPDQLRLETLGLFGSPAMLAATDGVRAAVLLPGESLAYVGTARDGFLGRFTRLPLTPEMIVAIMLRRPDLVDADEATVTYLEGDISRLLLKKGRLSQTVDFDRSNNIVRVTYMADDRPVSALVYSRYAQGFPKQIDLDLIDMGVQVTISYDDVETNVELDDALFRLVPSAGYRIEPFPPR